MSFTKVKDKINLNKLYLSFNILKLEDIFELETCKFMYLQYNNLLPKVFADYFTLVSKCHSYFFLILFLYFILPDSQVKATEALIHRVSNYPDLLQDMPRYYCPLVI